MTEDRRSALESKVGHPGDRRDALIERIQANGLTLFSSIEADWLELMWCLDQYRVESVCPRGMGNPTVTDESRRFAAVYRTKGNWFARVLALLLQNQTSQDIQAKGPVEGFSQRHQVDIAWPAREKDPLICIETKVTGGPAYGTTQQRGGMADFVNRRKEVKFAATDLKLYRSQEQTRIEHWDVWRANAAPQTYFMWAARLRVDAPPVHSRRPVRDRSDRLEQLIAEAQALVNTYLEGAGLIAWRVRTDGAGYESVPIPQAGRVTRLDDVLQRVGAEVRRLAPMGTPPKPHVPAHRVVAVDKLEEDEMVEQ